MKLGLISQIRDESDIIETWLHHVDSLFDQVYLIDHQSVDGTTDLLKRAVQQRPDWKYFYLDVKTYLQAPVSTILMHEAFTTGLDYLFFLDADEFIQVKSRNELEILLSTRTDKHIMADLHWKNCIRQDLEDTPFSPRDPLWIPNSISNHKKLVIPSSVYAHFGRNLKIIHGNHSAFTTSGIKLRSAGIGTILHIPIRSREQAAKKVILMAIAKRGYSKTDSARSTQIYEILQRIAFGKLSDEEVRGFTIAYDKISQGKTSINESELLEQGYSLSSLLRLKVARNVSLQFDPVSPQLSHARQYANALSNLEENIPDDVRLIIQNNVIRIDPADLNRPWYRKLKNRSESIKSKLSRKMHF